MKTQHLGIQQNPSTFLFPVRVIRFERDEENETEVTGNQWNLIGKPRGIDCPDALNSVISAFKAEFPRGKVEVEVDAMETRTFRQSDLKWLFDHPATFVSSL